MSIRADEFKDRVERALVNLEAHYHMEACGWSMDVDGLNHEYEKIAMVVGVCRAIVCLIWEEAELQGDVPHGNGNRPERRGGELK